MNHRILLTVLLPLAMSTAACTASDASDEATGESADELSAASFLQPEPSGHAARYPFVLFHGNAATPTHWGMLGIQEALERDGHVVEESTAPIASTEVRAEIVAKAVDAAMAGCRASRRCDGSKVNIIAHSQGGLDARLVASMPRFAGKIASISLIATPNRGTSVADVLLRATTEGIRDVASEAVDFWARSFVPPGYPEADGTGVWRSLSTKGAAELNAKTPDRKDIFYQSWAGISYPFAHRSDEAARTARAACEGKILEHPGRHDWLDKTMLGGYPILAGASHEPNDGLVTVHSAKWGQFNGCIPTDHKDEVGTAVSDQPDHRTGWNHVRFYRTLAFGIAQRGF
jgi:triacylglycerol lipase